MQLMVYDLTISIYKYVLEMFQEI